MFAVASPLSGLVAQFPVLNRCVAAFDFDDTLVPNTGWSFLKWVYPHHPIELIRGPFNLARVVQGARKLDRPYLERLQADTARPRYEAIFAEFAELTWQEHIFESTAEAWAWHRANLQRMVLITGAFEAAAQPFLGTLNPDHRYINDTFYPVPVTAYKKPGILEKLFAAEGLRPHTVYTDSHSDRHMLEKIHWEQVHVVQPKRKMRELAEKRGWSLLARHDSNPDYPEPVRHYAHRVIRNPDPNARFNFYNYWSRFFVAYRRVAENYLAERPVSDPTALLNLIAVAGLWIKEPPSVQQQLRSFLIYDFQALGLRLYQQLMLQNSESELPLRSYPSLTIG